MIRFFFDTQNRIANLQPHRRGCLASIGFARQNRINIGPGPTFEWSFE